jgi:hypothetical protein
MARVMLLLVFGLMVAGPAQAADWLLIRWIGPQRCEVTATPPRFGRWEEVAVYPTQKKAEQAMAGLTAKKLCRPEPAPRMPG